MEWISRFDGKLIALDTAPLIYFIERQPSYIDLLRPFFAAVDEGRIRVVTSVITLLEVLVHPLRRGDDGLARQYYDILLSSPNITTNQVTSHTAELAAKLRAQFDFATPDAIQLATALTSGADAFFTNDRQFGKFAEIEIVRLSQLTGQT